MGPPRTVLVAEDESIIALDIRMTLEQLGYDVVAVVATAADAIAAAEKHRPDITLLDIQLRGEGDGIDAATAIRERLNLPFLYLTANADAATVERARATAPAGYLIKPFEEGDLAVALEMALERRKVELALEASQRWLEATLRSIADGVIATDCEDRVQFLNPAAERLTGWTNVEALGQLLTDVLMVWTGDAASNEAETVEGVLVTRSGRDVAVEQRATPIHDRTATIVGRVLVLRDVTERREAELERERLLGELRRSNEELGDFAAVASHDLREPLRKIRMFGDRLLRHADELPERAKDSVERMQSAAERMERLVADLLALAHVRTATQTQVEVDLAEVVAEVLGDLEARIADSGGRVEVGALPKLVADPLQIRQLLQNLIANGLKFHLPGHPPTVRVAAEIRGARCLLRVEDDGVGFDPKSAQKIFRPFERLHSRTDYDGTGVGLAICARIVERHGGSIRAESALGEGARFFVELPIGEVRAPSTNA